MEEKGGKQDKEHNWAPHRPGKGCWYLTWSVFLLQTVMAGPLLLLLLGPPPLHSWHHTGIQQESGGGGDSKFGPSEDGETVPIGH